MDSPSSFAVLLRESREAANLTQEALDKRAGFSSRTSSDLERGIVRAPRAGTLLVLADALDLGAPERQRWERLRARLSNFHLARFLHLQGKASHAATLAGTAFTAMEAIGTPVQPQLLEEHDAFIATLEAELGADFESAWAAGAELTLDEAVALGLGEAKDTLEIR